MLPQQQQKNKQTTNTHTHTGIEDAISPKAGGGTVQPTWLIFAECKNTHSCIAGVSHCHTTGLSFTHALFG